MPALSSDNKEKVEPGMMLIAEDFFAWAQDFEGFDLTKSVNIQKFSDDASDRTAGIVFRIQLTTFKSQNTCAIPLF